MAEDWPGVKRPGSWPTGARVILTEMRPLTMTPAHNSGNLAELVCSLWGGKPPTRPGGLLKAELRALNSLIMECADAARVPAGGGLAVERNRLPSWSPKKYP